MKKVLFRRLWKIDKCFCDVQMLHGASLCFNIETLRGLVFRISKKLLSIIFVVVTVDHGEPSRVGRIELSCGILLSF